MVRVGESTAIHGPGDTFASYECEGDKCRVYVVTNWLPRIHGTYRPHTRTRQMYLQDHE